jgi:Flp pilus assembly protein TadD/tetrahydromethanopterin S-methyltransferase subunit B
MKWFSVVVVLLLLAAGARAEGPDDQYVAIYNLIQEADSLNNAGQFTKALAKYHEAQTALLQLQKGYPDWSADVVKFRLKYIANAMDALAAKVPAPAAPPANTSGQNQAGPPSTAAAPPGKPAPSPELENKVNALNDQVRQLQEDRASLEAKLKEALAAQPSAVDPRQLAKADEKIRALLKENALLQVGADQEKAKPAPSPDTKSLEKTRQELERTSRDLAQQTRKANALEKDKAALEARLKNLPATSYNADEIKSTRKELESANQKLAEQTKLADQLARDKQDMESRMKAMQDDGQAATAIRAENEILKKQLADRTGAPAPASASTTAKEDQGAQSGRAQAQVASLEKTRDTLRKENEALKEQLKKQTLLPVAATNAPQTAKAQDSKRIKKLEQERDDLKQQLEASNKELKSARATATVKAPQVAEALDAKRIKKLEQERDDLRKKLDAATQELASRKGKATPARTLEIEKQLASMRAKLDVLEASPVPYTPEEAALFRVPESKPVETASKSSRKASKELPAGSVTLYAEAKRYYSAKQWDKAEDRYLQVLREDQNHVPTLANLAAVELELNHLPQAETNIQQALALAPDDPACLAILGNLRFRQAKYDAAFDALSRAAKADPRNAEVQNYLGLTLSAQGLRGPAETALRKAIQLEPRYGDAHNNLAVIYATQKPPLLELARWHYQRAQDAGSKPNPDLEKLLEPKNGAEAAK